MSDEPPKHVSRLLLACSLVFLLSCTTATLAQTQRICQLTGLQDRSASGAPTGMQLSGITGGVTGTDIGRPVRAPRQAAFPFR